MSEATLATQAIAYLDRHPNQRAAFDAAEQLERNASPGSKAGDPFIHHGIPVNAPYDGELLMDTLEIIRQGEAHGDEFPETILCLNALRSTDPRKTIQPTTDLVRDFQRTYPDMPLSFFVRQYPENTPISELRGNVTDGMLAYRFRGEHPLRPTRRMLFVAHDADMTYRSPDYVPKMYEKITEREDALAVRSAMRSTFTGLPKIDAILRLDDLHYNLGFKTAETSVGFDLETYCKSDGYPANSLGETARMIKTFPGYVRGRSIVNASDVVLETSSRHLVEGMLSEQPDSPWGTNLDLAVGGRGDRVQPLTVDGDISDEAYRAWAIEFREGILTHAPFIRYNKKMRTDGFSHEAAVQAAFGLVGEMQKHTNLPGVPPLTTEAGNEMVRAALRNARVAI